MESDLNTVIDFLMKGSISIMGVIVGYFIAKNKYIFQKTYDQKLILVTDLHGKISHLEFELRIYISTIGSDMSEESVDEKIKSFNKIKDCFQQFQQKFWDAEIIFDDSLIKEIKKFSETFIKISSRLSMSIKKQSSRNDDEALNSWNKSFELFSSDLVSIKNKLKEEFRKTLKTNS